MAKVVSSKKKAGGKDVKVNKVLITHIRPQTGKSPYFDLAKKYGFDLEFHPFIKVEGLSGKDFRKQKIDIQAYSAIVFTSRKAIDHFFRICEELKIKVSQDMKYFCSTEAVALYLQKFILYRKRKVFFSPDGSTDGLLEIITKHKNNESFILPTSDNGGKSDICQFMEAQECTFVEATLYRTLATDIEPVMKEGYDVIVFFSPNSVQTLFEHNPKFKQNGMLIGAFGPSTSKAIEDAGLRLDIKAPMPNAPSMASAIELFLKDK